MEQNRREESGGIRHTLNSSPSQSTHPFLFCPILSVPKQEVEKGKAGEVSVNLLPEATVLQANPMLP